MEISIDLSLQELAVVLSSLTMNIRYLEFAMHNTTNEEAIARYKEAISVKKIVYDKLEKFLP